MTVVSWTNDRTGVVGRQRLGSFQAACLAVALAPDILQIYHK
jgi:hypothetical protein